ncbi:uncharacterized protein LOC101452402 [Ceratitis capitata]|uniref:uncharacterized protein LOC101452402 n=1 Tax=Ceratitis capitata TaxID=7213 RepID=UPI00032A0B5B|nr:uncharacterized protein LOC101452402 [Ceratitis capitata]
MGDTEEKHWTPALTMKLIEESEKRQCLWSREDPEYKNKTLKQIAYEEVAEIVDMPCESVKEKLRNLRINFWQVHKKNVKMGSSAFPPKWEYYKPLLFLAESIFPYSKASTWSTPKPRNRNRSRNTRSSRISSILRESKRRKVAVQEYKQEIPEICLDPLFDGCTSTVSTANNVKDTHIEPTNNGNVKETHEKFGEYVAFNLNNLEDVQLIKKTKAKIQLILSEALRERALSELAESESNVQF